MNDFVTLCFFFCGNFKGYAYALYSSEVMSFEEYVCIPLKAITGPPGCRAIKLRIEGGGGLGSYDSSEIPLPQLSQLPQPIPSSIPKLEPIPADA